MSFTDNIIFNIKARTPLPKADVDHRHVSDDDDLFQQPFRPMAEPINRSQKTIYIEKIQRLLQQATANKATI